VTDLLKILTQDDHDRNRAGAVGQILIHQLRILIAWNHSQLESGRHVGELRNNGHGVRGVATPVLGDDQQLAPSVGRHRRDRPIGNSGELIDPLPQCAVLGVARGEEGIER
jgi:hypothetical protein